MCISLKFNSVEKFFMNLKCTCKVEGITEIHIKMLFHTARFTLFYAVNHRLCIHAAMSSLFHNLRLLLLNEN